MMIRSAREEDAPALAAIYAPYVEHTAVTFEYDVPSDAEFASRIRETLKKYPYLVLEEKGTLLGYAYAGTFKARAAYAWAVEASVYVRRDARGRGCGRALYEALEKELRRLGFLNLYACITWLDREDEYLTHDSPRFHERMGFVRCALFRQCGYKFGRWYDMIWMGKDLGEHTACPAPPVLAQYPAGDGKAPEE